MVCIPFPCGAVVLNGEERYALNEGSWYRLKEAFKRGVDSEFSNLYAESDKNLRPFREVGPSQNKKKGKHYYQSEKSYNKEIADETGYLLLDSRLIEIEDVPGPGIEVCDLVDLDQRRLIHIKKSSRRSSTLSHLFKQGSNAAQMMKKYEAFNVQIVNTVQKDYGDTKAAELEKELDNKWVVEFRIADFPRANGQHNIPFFSKLTLRDEARNIKAMGFDVRVGFIRLTKVTKSA